MVRKIRKTFDWEVCARYLAAATVLYVVGGALLHGAAARTSAARVLSGG